MYKQRERDDLLKRIRPGTSHTNDFTKAVSRCFECADVVAQRRRELSFDASVTPEQRKEELARLVNEDLLPDLAEAVQPARRAKAIVAAERQKLRYGSTWPGAPWRCSRTLRRSTPPCSSPDARWHRQAGSPPSTSKC